MDTHDVSRDRLLPEEEAEPSKALTRVLSTLPKGALVIGVESDGLFTPNEQRELAAHIPEAELLMIQSKNGHDGFLLEFDELNRYV
jgi:homoserine O-acetyltransferase